MDMRNDRRSFNYNLSSCQYLPEKISGPNENVSQPNLNWAGRTKSLARRPFD